MIWTAVAVVIIGCGVLIAALILPPPGEIDSSVLVAFGEILTFAGALLGIHFRNRDNRKTNSR